MRNFRDYISEESLVSAAKSRPVTGFIDGKQFIVQGKDKTWRFAIVSMSTDLSKQSNAIRDSLMAWATVTDNAGSKWQLYMRKNGSFRLWGKNGSTIGPTVEGRFRKESIRQGMTEGSHDFKDFKDPWAKMSPEDRREAGRLQIAALKAFPSSPRQRELRAKLNLLLKKYGLLKGGDK